MEAYFVRSRGKLAGPFELDALQQLVKRGKISRFDQLSADKTAWRSAGDFAELFAPPAPRRAAVAEPIQDDTPQPVDDGTYGMEAGGYVPPGSAAVAFYYAQNGAAVGPVPLSVLQTLATNGTLRGDDPVWAEGSDIATPARQVPMLASFYSGRSKARQGGASAVVDNTNLPQSVRSTQFYAKVVYIVVATATLIFSLMPIGIVDGHPVWWWQGDGWLIAGTVYTVIASTALLIVTPLTAGLTRPLVALSLIGAPALIGLFATVLKAADQNASGITILAIVTTWGLMVIPVLLGVITRLRPRWLDGGPTGARVTSIVLGGLLALASIGGVVLLCLAADNWTGRPTATSVTAYVFTWLGVLAELAAGILSIVSGKPSFSIGVNRTALICLSGAAGVYMLTVLIALVAFDRAFSGVYAGTIAYILFRSLVLLAASLMWLSVAFQETYAWAFRGSAIE